MLKEFKKFALKGNMIDLAVGVIIEAVEFFDYGICCLSCSEAVK